jgi:hypothetical protein
MQGDGKGALWALDTKMQLWGMVQTAPGGSWGPWTGPNWEKAPKLRNIAAVETTVKKNNETYHGACIWGDNRRAPDYIQRTIQTQRELVWLVGGQLQRLTNGIRDYCRKTEQSECPRVGHQR